MPSEIERKFLVTDVPNEVTNASAIAMRQGYLAEEDDVEVRVRIADSTATLTVKAGRGLLRVEVELPMTVDEAEELWPHTARRRVDKRRHRIELHDHTIEVDVYAGELAGLVVAEVEFIDAASAAAFDPPAWFAHELTGHKEWSNAALSRDGRPAMP